MVAPLIGVVVPVILETDRIENQVVMDVIPVYVGGEDKLMDFRVLGQIVVQYGVLESGLSRGDYPNYIFF